MINSKISSDHPYNPYFCNHRVCVDIIALMTGKKESELVPYLDGSKRVLIPIERELQKVEDVMQGRRPGQDLLIKLIADRSRCEKRMAKNLCYRANNRDKNLSLPCEKKANNLG